VEKLTPFYEILIKINLQTLVDVCGYEFPTNSQNFMQKRLNRSENIPKSFRGADF